MGKNAPSTGGRVMYRALAWTLVVCLAATGCRSLRRAPFAQSPMLLHYKPTLSDSATILAEMHARREPEKPPMPGNSPDESPTVPAKSDVLPWPDGAAGPNRDQLPPPGSPLGSRTEASPIIRASAHPSTLEAQSRPTASSHVADAEPLLPPPPRTDAVDEKPSAGHSSPLVPPTTASLEEAETFKTHVPVMEIVGGLPIQIEETSLLTASNQATDKPRVSLRTVPENYGHDPDRRWLQGVLERHYRGYWCLRYCDPSVEDEFGGKVRLQDDERVANFRDGDVVAVSGQIVEQTGLNPLYRIQDIWLVRPR